MAKDNGNYLTFTSEIAQLAKYHSFFYGGEKCTTENSSSYSPFGSIFWIPGVQWGRETNMPSFLWNRQHRLLKRGLNSFPLEFLPKSLLNLQWSFIRRLWDTGDKLLGTSVFGFLVCKPQKNFDSEGNP